MTELKRAACLTPSTSRGWQFFVPVRGLFGNPVVYPTTDFLSLTPWHEHHAKNAGLLLHLALCLLCSNTLEDFKRDTKHHIVKLDLGAKVQNLC